MEIIVTTVPQLRELIFEAISGALVDAYPFRTAQPRTTYLSTKEAALIIKKTEGALRQIVHKGGIPSIKRGNSLLFLEEDLLKWIEKGRRDIVSEENPAKFLKKTKD